MGHSEDILQVVFLVVFVAFCNSAACKGLMAEDEFVVFCGFLCFLWSRSLAAATAWAIDRL